MSTPLIAPAPAVAGPLAADHSLVEAARSGDRAARDEIYRRFAPAVNAAALARVGPADADDITQEVFMHAWSRLGDVRDPDLLGPWLMQSARRRAGSWIRRITRARRTAHAAAAIKPGFHREASPAITCDEALAAIRSLPEAYRETLILRLVEGLTGPQIARCTGLTEGSVRVNLCRGLAMLRTVLEAHGHILPRPDPA